MAFTRRLVSTVAVTALLAGCGADIASVAEIDSTESRIVGVDTYLYLRCNATGWEVGPANRLQSTGSAGSFAVTYDVTQPWIAAGDDCALTETNQLDGWGTKQVYYRASASVVVPGGGSIAAGSGSFRVTYPGTGKYRMDVDWNRRTFTMTQVNAVFSPVAVFGESANYQPSTPSRWHVASNANDNRYFLNTTNYSAASGGGLGEYSLVRDRQYSDVILKTKAKTSENPAANASADLALVYGFRDANNYSFLSLSVQANQTRLFRVVNGQRTAIATASRAGIADTNYHALELWRHGQWIRATLDSEEILSVVDEGEPIVGQVGVGSLDDSAWFDDIQVVNYPVTLTPHFRLTMPSDLSQYQDSVTSLLENAYQVLLSGTGWGPSERAGGLYEYGYRPYGWHYWDDPNGMFLDGGLSGGLCLSVVTSDLIPGCRTPASSPYNDFVAITLHELGNGWNLPGAGQPQWVEWLRSESHSGFLKREAQLDLGYCELAKREHADSYAGYLNASLDDRRIYGLVEPLLVSLREKYGWGVFQALYTATLHGELDYLENLGPVERDNEAVLFLSRQVNESLVEFFERELGIQTMDYVREALAGLPVSNLTVVSTLPCRPATLRATPTALSLTATAGDRRPLTTLHVQAPTDWTARMVAPASWLTITRNGTTSLTTITVQADASGMATGSMATNQIVLEGAGLVGSPVRIPVTVHVQ